MQAVSNAWKTAQEGTVAPKRTIQISFSQNEVEDTPTVSATYYDSDLSDLSALPDPKNYTERYSVLEQNFIELSPVSHIRPADYFSSIKQGAVGSELAGQYRAFPHPFQISYHFANVQTETLDNMTVIWSELYQDSYPQGYWVYFYNGGSLVKSIQVTEKGYMQNINPNVSEYDSIYILVSSWSLPYTRARCQLIFTGVDFIISDADLISFSHKESFDPLSFSLPESKIDFEIENLQEQWNPDNPSGFYQYLSRRQKVIAKYGFVLPLGTEWINGGTFYMSEWDTPQNGISVKFGARGLIDFMDVDFNVNTLMSSVGATELPFDCSLTDIINSAFAQCGITNYVLTDVSGNDKTITIDTDFGYKCSHILQYAANALKAIIYSDRNGIVNVVGWDKDTPSLDSSYTISQFVSFKNAEYQQTKDIKAVDVNNGLGGYVSNKSVGEIQTIQNPFIQTQAHADSVGHWIYTWLSSIKLVSGEYRADPRLDIGDEVLLETKYATNDVIITDYDYNFAGMVRGKYEGRII